ncbi:NADP-dependent oxidoreductase [Nocardiopsis changdeensis]|uniref:NADP-dependent oxidoreductase n=1 Tax=Nocardiopsis changdeensis TaxID=2831969 RepID=A0ABX8BKJ5_9ACTN|nr:MULTISPECIES: NADP-dependent oxidoreductase [Nocardiopsis]QUX21824.1 NADP-dependent oxidoreductase [Nocardiopsis changdeensis]QYX37759.1 NADP-dependent oxidoreductase [Nocardiopsis sp. MT53]
MHAVAITRFGDPEVLTPVDLPLPEPGPGQVRVRVAAVGTLPLDARIRRGELPWRDRIDLPLVPGNQFAGTVDALGEGTAGPAAGTPVLGFSTFGAYAEHIVVGADQVVPRPDALPEAEAAALPARGQGAVMVLEALGVGPGDTLFVNSAAGGLGSAIVRLALLRGADRVIGAASERHHGHLRALGAVPVTYGDTMVEQVRAVAPDGVDAGYDARDDASLRQVLEIVGAPERVLSMVSPDAPARFGTAAVDGVRSAERLASVVGLYERGEYAVELREVLPLAEAARAHRILDSGHGRGAVVLTP